jgi:cytoskeleton protein RodZ
MESVGSQLRQARLNLGLTLEQACAKTRISVRNLQAIEADDLTRFSSAFFYRSFVKQFAEYLNVDYDRLAGAVQEVVSAIPEPLVPGQVPAIGQAPERRFVPSPMTQRLWNPRWLSSLASFVLILVACSSFYSVWQNSRSNWRGSITTFLKSLARASSGAHTASSDAKLAQIAPAIPQPPASSIRATPDNIAKPSVAPSASPQPPQADAASTGSEAVFHVELSVVERTWLSIVSDGKQVFSGILEPAETKVLEGHETARIRTGNAGALSLVFNGKPIGSLGPRGQVRTVIFTKDNYEVLEPAAHLTLTHFDPNAEWSVQVQRRILPLLRQQARSFLPLAVVGVSGVPS